MTRDEFNDKWNEYLEEGHYGVDIGNALVIQYLDSEFKKETESNPLFKYFQVKLKFGMARVYTNSKMDSVWQTEIDMIFGNNEPSIFAPVNSRF